MKKVLLTGAGGFIGRHCLKTLTDLGYEVHAVTRGKSPGNECILHNIDLLDFIQIKELFENVRPSHLLHFAWDVTPGEYWTSSKNLLWVQSSLEILKRFYEQGGRRVVMAGTCAEYDLRYGYCSELSTPTKPSTLYGTCKNAMYMIHENFSKNNGLSSAWGRVFFLYGPFEKPTRLVPSVINALLKDNHVKCSHGNQIRDFLHVQDVADAFVYLLDSNVIGAVNIGSGKACLLKDIIREIAGQIGRPDLVNLGALSTSAEEPPVIIADTRRLTEEVGWTPKIDYKDGIRQTINWWGKK